MNRSPATGPVRLSVSMVTYKHAPFIAQAIESVLMQQTTFPIELVVGEDCSPDATREIVRHYAEKYPDIVRPILHEKNVGAAANLAAVKDACRGEYVAVLEGDDYWTDPHKLQRQVEWLDAHPRSALCFHNAEIIDEARGGATRLYCAPDQKELVTLDDLLARNPVPTCAVVYRRASFLTLPEQFKKLPMQDWPSWILLARTGPLGYLNFVGSCYRLHGSSAWSSKPVLDQLRNILRMYEPLSELLGPAYADRLLAARKTIQDWIVTTHADAGRWPEARAAALDYLGMPPRRFRPPPGRAMVYARLLLNMPSAVMREVVRSGRS